MNVIFALNFVQLEIPWETTNLSSTETGNPKQDIFSKINWKFNLYHNIIYVDLNISTILLIQKKRSVLHNLPGRSNVSLLESHEDLVMSKMIFLGPGEGFSCLECQYSSTMKSNIRHHVESRHLDLSYPCSVCDKVQKSYKAWYTHLKTHTTTTWLLVYVVFTVIMFVVSNNIMSEINCKCKTYNLHNKTSIIE